MKKKSMSMNNIEKNFKKEILKIEIYKTVSIERFEYGTRGWE